MRIANLGLVSSRLHALFVLFRFANQVNELFVFDNLGRKSVTSVAAGEIVMIAGIEDIGIGDTIVDKVHFASSASTACGVKTLLFPRHPLLFFTRGTTHLTGSLLDRRATRTALCPWSPSPLRSRRCA